MSRSKLRGHPIYFDGECWRYANNRQKTVGNKRPCKLCPNDKSETDYDFCLGKLGRVINACCGHGERNESYIQFENGLIVSGFTVEQPTEKEE